MAGRFTRTVENFACEKCGAAVTGNGFTNHCPRCLHSKHVDENPGDRAARCHGLMAPIAIEQGRSGWVVVHKCLACGEVKRNKSAPDDDQRELREIARRRALS